MLLRMIDFLKSRGVTAIFTHLMHGGDAMIQTDAGLSSLMDAWILLLNREANGEFNRELYVLKARGIAHSNQVREFLMSDAGINLVPPYLGESGALTGSARKAEEARTRRAEALRRVDAHRVAGAARAAPPPHPRSLEALQAELDADDIELKALGEREKEILRQAEKDKHEMQESRRADEKPTE